MYIKSKIGGFNYQIVNSLNTEVIVSHRGSMRWSIPGVEGVVYNGTVKLRITTDFYYPNKVDLTPDEKDTPLDIKIKKGLADGIKDSATIQNASMLNCDFQCTVSFEIGLTEGDMCETRYSSISSNILGITLYSSNSLKDNELDPERTTRGHILRRMEASALNRGKDKGCLLTGVGLLDRYSRFGQLWTIALGNPIKIPLISGDNTMPDGLYITWFNEFSQSVNKEFIRIDELDEKVLIKYGLYKTRQETIELGRTRIVISCMDKIDDLLDNNRKLDNIINKLNKEVNNKEVELRELQNEYKSFKNQIKIQQECAKLNTEQTKLKSTRESNGDAFKIFTGLATLLFTGIKLFS